MNTPHAERRLILGSALIGSIGTFGMHLLLPALPAIATAFDTNAANTQLLISLSLVAVALGNLAVAPMSDRYGRRPIVLIGLMLFLSGSLAGIVAPTLEVLVVARIIQAFGGGAAMAVIRATITDYFGPSRAASALAATATAILVVPMFAPTLGGLAILWQGWQSTFALAALMGALVLRFAWLRLHETRPPDPDRSRRPRMLASYRQLLASRTFLAYVAYGASMMGTIYTFVTCSPYVAIDIMGISPARYGLLFFFPALAAFIGFFTASRLAHRISALRLMRVGALLATLASLIMLAGLALGLWHPLMLFLPGMLVCFANALSAPSTTTTAITLHPSIVGAASGLLGCLQLFVAAAVSQAVAMLTQDSPLPLAAAMLVLSLLAVAMHARIARGGNQEST